MVGTCFVMQPFDKGEYDKRYDEVLVPAIEAAGLEAYRVDRDLGVEIPINEIATQIQRATACVCDITTDNPNVWFELGYAMALGKGVVLICGNERTSPFPFDVRHRSIVEYATDSRGDFDHLQRQVTERLSRMKESRTSEYDRAPAGNRELSAQASIEDLEDYEVAVLVSLASTITNEDDDALAITQIRQRLRAMGFNETAAALAVRALLDQRLIATRQLSYDNGFPYTAYALTETGTAWLFTNKHRLDLQSAGSAW
jgi:nucleoside 2-deoxyribosyltransferase